VIQFGDGSRIESDGTYQAPIVVQNPDGSVQLDNGAIIRSDGTVVTPGGFVIPPIGARGPGLATPTTIGELQPPSPVTVTAEPTTTTEVQP
ncbi:MAG TPA: hypothetical protein VHN36_15600, partial [Ilumatobacteraceae bacterium]|nr:hypothetical protein [Ilumatobacteraceae bacterium]